MAVCPYHGDHDPSLAIYRDHAYCHGCGKFLWPDQLLREHPVLQVSHQSRGGSGKAAYLPRSLADTYHKWLIDRYPMKLGWLRDRGFTDGSIDAFGFGYTGLAYSIPVYDGAGRLQALRFRRDDVLTEEGSKYWGLPGSNNVALYLGGPLVSRVDECWLCEGELDAALLHQHGLLAVSLTNGARAFRREHAGLFRGVGRLVVAYDQDAAGEAGFQRVREGLAPGGLAPAQRAVWPPEWGKDVTEAIGRVGFPAFLEEVRPKGDHPGAGAVHRPGGRGRWALRGSPAPGAS